MWYGEHHGLVEYSHCQHRTTYGLGRSTNRTHTYRLRHHYLRSQRTPVRIAERAAMLDHVTNNRFEFELDEVQEATNS